MSFSAWHIFCAIVCGLIALEEERSGAWGIIWGAIFGLLAILIYIVIGKKN